MRNRGAPPPTSKAMTSKAMTAPTDDPGELDTLANQAAASVIRAAGYPPDTVVRLAAEYVQHARDTARHQTPGAFIALATLTALQETGVTPAAALRANTPIALNDAEVAALNRALRSYAAPDGPVDSGVAIAAAVGTDNTPAAQPTRILAAIERQLRCHPDWRPGINLLNGAAAKAIVVDAIKAVLAAHQNR